MKKNTKTVDDLSGFNFVPNPQKKGTHIFECLDGFFICKSPKGDERFKDQEVIRKASNLEVNHFISRINPEPQCD